ncbi:MAG: hypothetical protein NT016_03955 [Candidatus Aenigmarchaeota archaeon]|nr:hypothetical protein [Candidatus Aenigmarchaeota archaeon]
MTIHFRQRKRFSKNFEGLSKEGKEILTKELRKWKIMGIEHIKYRSKHLKGEYAGIRKISLGRMRLYFLICDECRKLGDDIKYGRCKKCPREPDLINLVDVIEFRREDTYDNLDFETEDVKDFTDGTYEV